MRSSSTHPWRPLFRPRRAPSSRADRETTRRRTLRPNTETAVLRAFAETVPTPVLATDKNGRVLVWNSAMARRAGKRAAEATGLRLDRVVPAGAFLLRCLVESLNTDRPLTLSGAPLRFPGDRERRYDITVHPLRLRGAALAVAHLRETDDYPLHMRELLARTEKMFSLCGIAAGMAHELNTPLCGMLQAAQNVIRRFDPHLPANIDAAGRHGCDLTAVRAYMEERGIRGFLDSLRETGARAGGIIAATLALSRNKPLPRANADPRALTQNALRLAAADYMLKKHFDFGAIHIEEHYQPDLPPLPCVSLEIEQVLLNLLKNAVQAMASREHAEEPRIVIRVRRQEDTLRFDVSDNGPGIPPEVQARIFEPFFTTKPAGEGSGLGLAVSHFIITVKHGGLFRVASRPGGGATFSILLPLRA